MTVSTTHIENTFTGNGSQLVFNFTFQALHKDHVIVSLAGVDQSLGFTTTLNSDQQQSPGGTVTFSVAPGLSVAVKARRSTPRTQLIDFTHEARLDMDAMEAAMDKFVMIAQEIAAGAVGPAGPAGPQGLPGDIVGPASSTDKAVAIWDGVSGALLKDGPVPAVNGHVMTVVSNAWAAAAPSTVTFPSGSIMFWDTTYGAIPAGWAAMDGSVVTINGSPYTTPDTRGKYLLCAAVADAGSSGFTGSTVRPGVISGSKTHQHTNAGSVSISSVVVTGSVATSGFGVQGGSSGIGAIHGTYPITANAHNHTGTLAGSTAANTEASRPIHVSLIAIIKVD